MPRSTTTTVRVNRLPLFGRQSARPLSRAVLAESCSFTIDFNRQMDHPISKFLPIYSNATRRSKTRRQFNFHRDFYYENVSASRASQFFPPRLIIHTFFDDLDVRGRIEVHQVQAAHLQFFLSLGVAAKTEGGSLILIASRINVDDG